MASPEVVADNEVPGPEPKGFWDPVHRQVRSFKEAVLSDDVFVLDDDD